MILANKSVLIVEDEGLVALDLALTIEEAGGKSLGPAQSLQAAMDILTNEEKRLVIDCAILDINLGDATVFPAARLCLRYAIPFIFHSAYASTEEMQREFANITVCMKPSNPDQIVQLIATCLGYHL